MKPILKKIFDTDIFKTILFNLHYLPLRSAVKLPILVCRRTSIVVLKGSVSFEGPSYFGRLLIGYNGTGTQDCYYERTKWHVLGNVVIRGKAALGRGTSISVGGKGNLIVGDNLLITGGSTIICNKRIEFGKNDLISWDVLVMDTDFHCIRDNEGLKINEDKPIIIGDSVWIGCRNTILKGSHMPNNSVLAAGSLLSRSVYEEGCIYGDNGRVLKKEIHWTMH